MEILPLWTKNYDQQPLPPRQKFLAPAMWDIKYKNGGLSVTKYVLFLNFEKKSRVYITHYV